MGQLQKFNYELPIRKDEICWMWSLYCGYVGKYPYFWEIQAEASASRCLQLSNGSAKENTQAQREEKREGGRERKVKILIIHNAGFMYSHCKKPADNLRTVSLWILSHNASPSKKSQHVWEIAKFSNRIN